MAWTDDLGDYDLFPLPDYLPEQSKEFWDSVRLVIPELMQGDGQDYFVSYPYSRLLPFRCIWAKTS